MSEDVRPFGGDSFWRELVGASKVPFGIVGAFAVALLVWALWPATPDHSLDLAGRIDPSPPAEFTLDAQSATALAGQSMIAAEKLIVNGVVQLPSHRVLVANEIEFAPDSALVVPSGHITVLAPRMTGAVIDVSGPPGADGQGAGAKGTMGVAGGTIVVAVGEASGTRLIANGGAGATGQPGHAGAAGQRGYCGPNGFRLAERGKNGGDGGTGGQGGGGGLIMVLHRYAAPEAQVDPGAPGRGAPGGSGGRGGAGCNGVRGSQPTQSVGNDGTPGHAGSRGQKGTVILRRVEFSNVLSAFDDWLDEDDTAPEKLRDRLRTITTYEGE